MVYQQIEILHKKARLTQTRFTVSMVTANKATSMRSFTIIVAF